MGQWMGRGNGAAWEVVLLTWSFLDQIVYLHVLFSTCTGGVVGRSGRHLHTVLYTIFVPAAVE